MTDTDDDDLLLENLTPATIHQIAWEVEDKTHDPKDAKRLLWKYIELVDKEEVLPVPLDRYVRDSFKRHLMKGEKLETAFGLTPGKRRGADELTRLNIVIELWERRLSGMTMQLALEEVAGVCGVSATTAVDYWNLHRQDAFLLYRIALRGEGRMLSEAQMEMAGKIFEKSNERARRLLESERMERDSQDTPEN